MLRKKAAEKNEQSLLSIQTQVNNKLVEMDRTIKIAHECQTLNDTNIQLLMENMDLFGEHVLMLQRNMK